MAVFAFFVHSIQQASKQAAHNDRPTNKWTECTSQAPADPPAILSAGGAGYRKRMVMMDGQIVCWGQRWASSLWNSSSCHCLLSSVRHTRLPHTSHTCAVRLQLDVRQAHWLQKGPGEERHRPPPSNTCWWRQWDKSAAQRRPLQDGRPWTDWPGHRLLVVLCPAIWPLVTYSA